MIEVPAVIERKDIYILGALKGMSNEVPITVDGVVSSVGRIVFRGFAGTLHLDDRLYHGVVRFEHCERSEFTVGNFSPIVQAMDITESEVDDVLHGDDHGND